MADKKKHRLYQQEVEKSVSRYKNISIVVGSVCKSSGLAIQFNKK